MKNWANEDEILKKQRGKIMNDEYDKWQEPDQHEWVAWVLLGATIFAALLFFAVVLFAGIKLLGII